MQRQDLGGQEPARRDQPRHAVPEPQPEHAEAFDELADQPAVAGLGGMAPCRRQLAPAGHRQRDAPVQSAPAAGIFDREQAETVIPQQGMQTPHGAIAVERQQQTVQRRQRGHPHPGVVRSEHVVHQIRVDPVEDGQIEQTGAVLRRQIAQQADTDVVSG